MLGCGGRSARVQQAPPLGVVRAGQPGTRGDGGARNFMVTCMCQRTICSNLVLPSEMLLDIKTYSLIIVSSSGFSIPANP